MAGNRAPEGWVQASLSLALVEVLGSGRGVQGKPCSWGVLQTSLTNGFVCGLSATTSYAGMRRMIGLVKTFSNTSKLSMQLSVRDKGRRIQTSSEVGDVISSFQLRTGKETIRGCKRKGLRTRVWFLLFLFFPSLPNSLNHPYPTRTHTQVAQGSARERTLNVRIHLHQSGWLSSAYKQMMDAWSTPDFKGHFCQR